MKVRGDFLGPPRSTDKTTLIIKVSKGAKISNRYNQVPHLTQDGTRHRGYPGHEMVIHLSQRFSSMLC